MLQAEYSGVVTIVEKCAEVVVESRTERNTFMMCCARLKNEMPTYMTSLHIIHRGLGVQLCATPPMYGDLNEGACSSCAPATNAGTSITYKTCCFYAQ